VEDQMLYELDMERQYEDPGFELDEVNTELQLLAELEAGSVEAAAYQEYVDALEQNWRYYGS